MSWWLSIFPTMKTRFMLEVGGLCPSISGPRVAQNWIHYFALYFHRFGLQANRTMGPPDLPLCVCTHASPCLCVHAFLNKSLFKTQPFIIWEMIWRFTACTFHGSWKISAANVFGRKHTALPQNSIPNLLGSCLQNLRFFLTFPVMYSFLI